jgi:hypothetical protein
MATRTAAFLEPGQGTRSLTTIVVPSDRVSFGAAWREGAYAPDFRVRLPVRGMGTLVLAVKDHHLLARAESVGEDLDRQVAALNESIRDMGPSVAVRLGLSRGFHAEDGAAAEGRCWLMADGFFSLSDPQP